MAINKLFRNVLSISLGQSSSLVIQFISLTLVARFLGVEHYGIFNYLLAIAIVISKLTDLGLSPVAFRESSKTNSDEFVNSAISLRLTALFIIAFFFFFISVVVGFSTMDVILINILLLNVVLSSKFQNIRELVEIPFKVRIISHYPMSVLVLDSLLFLFFVLLIPIFDLGLLYVVITYVISNLPGFFILLYLLKKKCSFSFNFTWGKAKFLWKESLPLMGYVFVIALFQQIDILILKNFVSDFSAGLFAAAARLTMPFNIIPSAIVSSVFPILVNNIRENPTKNYDLIKFINKLLFFISFALASLFVFKADEVINFVFGSAYKNSSNPSIYLFISQIFFFYNFFNVDLLIAYGKQKFTLYYAVAMLLSYFLFAFLLIPHYSYTGAAVAKLCAIIFGSLILSYIISLLKIKVFFISWEVIVACITLLVVFFLLANLHIVLYSILAIIFLIVIPLIFKFFSDYEILSLFRLINKETWGVKLLRIL